MLFLTLFFFFFVNFGFTSQFVGSWIEPGSGVQTEFKPLDLQGSRSYFLIFFHLAPSMGFFRLQKRNQSLSLHSPPPSPVIILPSSLLFPPPPLPGGSSPPGLSGVSLPEHSLQNPSSFRCNFRQVSLSPLSKKPHRRYPVPISFLHRIYHTLKF